MAGDGTFSELQLGIRELFRIVVPGAFAVLLLKALPDMSLPSSLADSTAGLTGVVFFLGLVGYSLRSHECWWPYSETFFGGVKKLEAAIEEIVGSRDARGDHGHKSLYKYFLTLGNREFGDRVHYFSSFYYMLITLSVYSALAAAAQLILPAISLTFLLTSWVGGVIATFFCLGSIAAQLGVIVRAKQIRAIKKARTRRLVLLAPLALLGGAVAVVTISLVTVGGLAFWSWPRVGLVASLSTIAVLFNVLGANQWRSIIDEQVVHVRASQAKLKEYVTSASSK